MKIKIVTLLCLTTTTSLLNAVKTLDTIVTQHQQNSILDSEPRAYDIGDRNKYESQYSSAEDVPRSGCKWEDCSDPNSICQVTDPGQSGKCVCNEFYEIDLSSSSLYASDQKLEQPLQSSDSSSESMDKIKCKRRTCHSNKDCSSAGYCSSKGICWPRCVDDVECDDEETCDLVSGTCLQKCFSDVDCTKGLGNICDPVKEVCRWVEEFEAGCDPASGEECKEIYEFELCDSSGCHSRCFQDSDCKLSQYCDSSSNFCFQITCLEDSNCAQNQYCDTNTKNCKFQGQDVDKESMKYSLLSL